VSIARDVALIFLSVGLLVAVIAAVALAARRFHIGPEIKRKIVHVATGGYALTLPLTFTDRWPVMLLLGVSIPVMLLLRSRFLVATEFGAVLHSVERRSYGEIYLSLAVGFIFFRSAGQPILYILPILVVTLSDAAAALVGTEYGRRLFRVEGGTKSLEGVATFFVVTWLVSMILLLLMSDAPRENVIVLGLLIAAFGALVEAQSWQGLDNLFVPIAIHLALWQYLDAPPATLAVLALSFILLMVGIVSFAPMLRLTRHAARGYAILTFLVLSYTAPHNAVLPVATVAIHIVARSRRPCSSPYPDLDLLATITGVGLFWLFVGEYFGRSAIDLFGLTFAAAAVILAAIALGRTARWLVWPVAILASAALFAVATLNAPQSSWHGPLWPWAAVALAIAATAELVLPAWFDRWRAPRVFLTAMPVPVVLFVAKGILG
jgi:phytol kinase